MGYSNDMYILVKSNVCMYVHSSLMAESLMMRVHVDLHGENVYTDVTLSLANIYVHAVKQ